MEIRKTLLSLPEKNSNDHIELTIQNPRLPPEEYIGRLRKQGIVIRDDVARLFNGKEILSSKDWVCIALIPTLGTKLSCSRYADVRGWANIEYPEYYLASAYAMLAIREHLTQDVLRGMGLGYVSLGREIGGEYLKMTLDYDLADPGHPDSISLSIAPQGRVYGDTAIPFEVRSSA